MSSSSTQDTQESLEFKIPEIVNKFTFEEAMEQAGFGLFNILLLLMGVLCTSAMVFQTLVMAFIVPSAECDLKLTVQRKGILISVVYIGMIISAIPWGFLADTHGRKAVLVTGFLIDGIIVVCASVCRNYVYLVVEMFMVGLAISGPFDCFMSYIAEMNSRRVRSRIILIIGFQIILATFSVTGLALYIIPQEWSIHIIGATFEPWQIFIMATAVPSFLAGIGFLLFPESPKFLMSIGFDKRALKILGTIYIFNTFKSRETFVVKKLTSDYKLRVRERESVYSRSVVVAYDLMKSFCTRELQMLAIRIFLMGFSIVMCHDTIRLWLPQLFVTSVEFQAVRKDKDHSWCHIVQFIVTESLAFNEDQRNCLQLEDTRSYVYNFCIGTGSLIGFVLALIVVNRVGAQIVLSTTLLLNALASFAFYWAETIWEIIVISSIFIAAGSISRIVIVYMAIHLFPTSMRAVIVAFTMTGARIGCVLGNFIFPLLIKIDCMVPLLWWGLVCLFACGLSLYLPNPK